MHFSNVNAVNNENQTNIITENDSKNEAIILTKVNEDGTTSNYFDKRKLKIAPRSTLQFKVGPPFEMVNTYGNVIDNKTGQVVQLRIIPRIDRGFDNIEDEWVGYKRNYFTLVASFETPNCSLESFLKSNYQVTLVENFYRQTAAIKYFAIKIEARSDDEHTEINLVQHTAKRDKGPQFAPAMCPLIPSELPKHQIIREASNVRNTNKMRKYDSTFYFHRDQEKNNFKEDCILHTYPKNCIQKVARYERVQFASSISVKKPSQQNRHFRLYVILGAVIETESLKEGFTSQHCEEITLGDGKKGIFVHLQEMNTPPLIIRGRSPSNYTNSQRITLRTNSMTPSSIDPCSQNLLTINSPNTTDLTTLNNSPKKAKVGRPAKRRSRVIEIMKPEPEMMMMTKNRIAFNDENYKVKRGSSLSGRDIKRVETLEQIEKMMLTQLPIFNKGISVKDIKKDDIILHSHDFNSYKERPATSRKLSVDLKDIELGPSYSVPSENLYIVGSLALTLQSDVSSALTISSKKRKYESDVLHISGSSSLCNNESANRTWKFNRPCSSAFGSEELSVEELSIINNISNNFYQFEHSNLLDELSTSPRSIPRSIEGARSTYSIGSTDREEMKKINNWTTNEMLSPELIETTHIFEDISFI